MGLYKDCCDVKCKNLSSSYCYAFHSYIEDSPTFHKYFLGEEDANNCQYLDSWASDSEKSDSGLCYLTTALVNYLGKPDDCEELMTLRLFRDKYLRQSSDGRKLIAEYYTSAPEIVKAIDQSNNKEEHYTYIQGVVNSCIKAINDGDNDLAIRLYYNMFKTLKNKFAL